MKITDRKAHAYERGLAQTWLAMKLTAFLLTVLLVQVSARTLSQTVTYKAKEVSLKQAFAEIKKQTGYLFFYKDQYLEKAKTVSPDLQNTPLKTAMDLLLKDQPLNFSIQGNTIFITLKNPADPNENAAPLPPLTDISGVVTDENGAPLSGAAVTIKATGKGTVTDAQGRFLIKGDITEKTIIIVQFTGYAKEEIIVGKQTVINAKMKVAVAELDKVVIQAYGTTTQRTATGNIATITSEQIEKQPNMNVLATLMGQVPGLIITQAGSGAYASAPFKVEIRGRAVINPNLPSEPLYIVDGVPLTVVDYGNNGQYATGSPGITQNGFTGPAGGQSPLFSINPGDIESITVLKDADATSIYGSRGANGVILINTKKGKPGKTTLEGKIYEGLSKITQHYDLLNTQQYVAMRKEAFKNDGVAMNTGNAPDLLLWDTTRYTDWQKAILSGTGHETEAQLSLMGGDKQTSFRISGTYHRQTDIFTISGSDQRTSLQFNLSHKSLNQKLTSTFTAMYSYTSSNITALAGAILLPPDAPAAFDASGNLNFAGWGAPNTAATGIFPFAKLLQPYSANTGFLNGRLNIQYTLLKGLNFLGNLGYSTTHNLQTQTFPIVSQDIRLNPTGNSFFGSNDAVNLIAEPTFDYKKTIGQARLNVVAGSSYQSSFNSGTYINASGYTNDNLLGSTAAAPRIGVSNGSGGYKYSALFARINYNLKDKYIINLSGRRDGSSKFGPGKQYGNFGSVGAAWVFSEESWIKDKVPFLSFGKLRGSYGTTGSDQIPTFQYIGLWTAGSPTPYQQGGAVSYSSTYLTNPDLAWQSNQKLEAAIDLGLLQDRLYVEIAYYQNRCGNQLVFFPLPQTTGFTQVAANWPALVQNAGWEAMFRYKFIDSKNIFWSTSFNIGFNQNKLISYPGLAQSPYAASFTVGQSLNIRRLLHYAGIDPQTGQYSYQDKNHDGNVSTSYNNGNNDLINKDLSVKYDGSISTDLRYRRIQLSVYFTFRKQNILGLGAYSGIPGSFGISANQPTQVLNRWQKPGDNTEFARFTAINSTSNDGNFASSDGSYVNVFYMRLRNLSLTYDLPRRANKQGSGSIKLFMRGENLFVISNFVGIDPEATTIGALPPQKVLTIGAQFNL